ncbi:hypothetical protein BDR05DRAFT_896352 [Suillus weaverae]|nr:hypothetical protein BDR05DRAFT_896352 [Suillus weaverae]
MHAISTVKLFPRCCISLTNRVEGNPWCIRVSGTCAHAIPIRVYRDNTSGNLSKGWNRHNSFPFTPERLPQAAVHQEYNVHFLCTSNLAPPLEMLNGIVDRLG